jgi:hypothetical protein
VAAVSPKRRVVALVGGLADPIDDLAADTIELRLFGSRRDAGAGELRRLQASVKRGGIDEVWILCCWMGHSESRAIVRLCRKRKIPVRMLGGRGQARREQ